MKFKVFIVTIFVMLASLSCKNDSSGDISKLEAKLQESPDNSVMQQLADAYVAKVKSKPTDASTNASYLSKAADLYIQMQRYSESAQTLNIAIKDYPEADSRTDNILSLASVYRNNLAASDPKGKNFSEFMNAIGDSGSFKTEVQNILQKLIEKMVNPQDKRIDKDVAMDYVNLIEMYAGALPEDDQSPEYLIKAGEMARNVSQFSRALNIYDWIMAKFPNSERASQALFFKGFTLDDNMNQKEEAKKYYEEFLQKYPDDDFADDTQFLLENLGKSDDEIIKAFEAKQKKAGK